MAAALGAHGEHVERAADLAPALDRAMRADVPAILNISIAGLPAPTY
jgi:acetolactate synthase-1/2/3 large subunit